MRYYIIYSLFCTVMYLVRGSDVSKNPITKNHSKTKRSTQLTSTRFKSIPAYDESPDNENTLVHPWYPNADAKQLKMAENLDNDYQPNLDPSVGNAKMKRDYQLYPLAKELYVLRDSDTEDRQPVSRDTKNRHSDSMSPTSAILGFKAHLHHDVRDIGKSFIHRPIKKDRLSTSIDLENEEYQNSLQLLDSDPDDQRAEINRIPRPRYLESENDRIIERVPNMARRQYTDLGYDENYVDKDQDKLERYQLGLNHIPFDQYDKSLRRYLNNDDRVDHLDYLDKYSRAIDRLGRDSLLLDNDLLVGNPRIVNVNGSPLEEGSKDGEVKTKSLAMAIEPLNGQLQQLVESVQQINEQLKEQEKRETKDKESRKKRQVPKDDDCDEDYLNHEVVEASLHPIEQSVTCTCYRLEDTTVPSIPTQPTEGQLDAILGRINTMLPLTTDVLPSSTPTPCPPIGELESDKVEIEQVTEPNGKPNCPYRFLRTNSIKLLEMLLPAEVIQNITANGIVIKVPTRKQRLVTLEVGDKDRIRGTSPLKRKKNRIRNIDNSRLSIRLRLPGVERVDAKNFNIKRKADEEKRNIDKELLNAYLEMLDNEEEGEQMKEYDEETGRIKRKRSIVSEARPPKVVKKSELSGSKRKAAGDKGMESKAKKVQRKGIKFGRRLMSVKDNKDEDKTEKVDKKTEKVDKKTEKVEKKTEKIEKNGQIPQGLASLNVKEVTIPDPFELLREYEAKLKNKTDKGKVSATKGRVGVAKIPGPHEMAQQVKEQKEKNGKASTQWTTVTIPDPFELLKELEVKEKSKSKAKSKSKDVKSIFGNVKISSPFAIAKAVKERNELLKATTKKPKRSLRYKRFGKNDGTDYLLDLTQSGDVNLGDFNLPGIPAVSSFIEEPSTESYLEYTLPELESVNKDSEVGNLDSADLYPDSSTQMFIPSIPLDMPTASMSTVYSNAQLSPDTRKPRMKAALLKHEAIDTEKIDEIREVTENSPEALKTNPAVFETETSILLELEIGLMTAAVTRPTSVNATSTTEAIVLTASTETTTTVESSSTETSSSTLVTNGTSPLTTQPSTSSSSEVSGTNDTFVESTQSINDTLEFILCMSATEPSTTETSTVETTESTTLNGTSTTELSTEINQTSTAELLTMNSTSTTELSSTLKSTPTTELSTEIYQTSTIKLSTEMNSTSTTESSTAMNSTSTAESSTAMNSTSTTELSTAMNTTSTTISTISTASSTTSTTMNTTSTALNLTESTIVNTTMELISNATTVASTTVSKTNDTEDFIACMSESEPTERSTETTESTELTSTTESVNSTIETTVTSTEATTKNKCDLTKKELMLQRDELEAIIKDLVNKEHKLEEEENNALKLMRTWQKQKERCGFFWDILFPRPPRPTKKPPRPTKTPTKRPTKRPPTTTLRTTTSTTVSPTTETFVTSRSTEMNSTESQSTTEAVNVTETLPSSTGVEVTNVTEFETTLPTSEEALNTTETSANETSATTPVSPTENTTMTETTSPSTTEEVTNVTESVTIQSNTINSTSSTYESKSSPETTEEILNTTLTSTTSFTTESITEMTSTPSNTTEETSSTTPCIDFEESTLPSSISEESTTVMPSTSTESTASASVSSNSTVTETSTIEETTNVTKSSSLPPTETSTVTASTAKETGTTEIPSTSSTEEPSTITETFLLSTTTNGSTASVEESQNLTETTEKITTETSLVSNTESKPNATESVSWSTLSWISNITESIWSSLSTEIFSSTSSTPLIETLGWLTTPTPLIETLGWLTTPTLPMTENATEPTLSTEEGATQTESPATVTSSIVTENITLILTENVTLATTESSKPSSTSVANETASSTMEMVSVTEATEVLKVSTQSTGVSESLLEVSTSSTSVVTNSSKTETTEVSEGLNQTASTITEIATSSMSSVTSSLGLKTSKASEETTQTATTEGIVSSMSSVTSSPGLNTTKVPEEMTQTTTETSESSSKVSTRSTGIVTSSSKTEATESSETSNQTTTTISEVSSSLISSVTSSPGPETSKTLEVSTQTTSGASKSSTKVSSSSTSMVTSSSKPELTEVSEESTQSATMVTEVSSSSMNSLASSLKPETTVISPSTPESTATSIVTSTQPESLKTSTGTKEAIKVSTEASSEAVESTASAEIFSSSVSSELTSKTTLLTTHLTTQGLTETSSIGSTEKESSVTFKTSTENPLLETTQSSVTTSHSSTENEATTSSLSVFSTKLTTESLTSTELSPETTLSNLQTTEKTESSSLLPTSTQTSSESTMTSMNGTKISSSEILTSQSTVLTSSGASSTTHSKTETTLITKTTQFETSTAAELTTAKASTTTEPIKAEISTTEFTTAEAPTTTKPAISEASKTTGPTTAGSSATTGPTIAETSTATGPETAEASTPAKSTVAEASTTIGPTVAKTSTTTEPTKAEISTTEFTTAEAPTTTKPTTSEASKTTGPTTAEASTTETTTAKSSATTGPTIAETSTATGPETAEASTPAKSTVAEASTTIGPTVAKTSTTTEPIKAEISTTEFTTAEAPTTTKPATSEASKTTGPTTAEASTTETTTAGSSATTGPTIAETSTATGPETAEASTPAKSTVAEASTTIGPTVAKTSTTTEPTKAEISTTEFTTAEAPTTTKPATSEASKTTGPTTAEASTTETTTAGSSTTTGPTIAETSTATGPETAETSTPAKSTVAEASTTIGPTVAKASTTTEPTKAEILTTEFTTAEAPTTTKPTTSEASKTTGPTTTEASTTETTTAKSSATTGPTIAETSTTTGPETAEASTTTGPETAEASTTAKSTIAEALTIGSTVAEASTTIGLTVAKVSTTIGPTTTQGSTAAETTTAESSTTGSTAAEATTTVVPTKAEASTTTKLTTAKSPTTAEPTSAETTVQTTESTIKTTESSTRKQTTELTTSITKTEQKETSPSTIKTTEPSITTKTTEAPIITTTVKTTQTSESSTTISTQSSTKEEIVESTSTAEETKTTELTTTKATDKTTVKTPGTILWVPSSIIVTNVPMDFGSSKAEESTSSAPVKSTESPIVTPTTEAAKTTKPSAVATTETSEESTTTGETSTVTEAEIKETSIPSTIEATKPSEKPSVAEETTEPETEKASTSSATGITGLLTTKTEPISTKTTQSTKTETTTSATTGSSTTTKITTLEETTESTSTTSEKAEQAKTSPSSSLSEITEISTHSSTILEVTTELSSTIASVASPITIQSSTVEETTNPTTSTTESATSTTVSVTYPKQSSSTAASVSESTTTKHSTSTVAQNTSKATEPTSSEKSEETVTASETSTEKLTTTESTSPTVLSTETSTVSSTPSTSMSTSSSTPAATTSTTGTSKPETTTSTTKEMTSLSTEETKPTTELSNTTVAEAIKTSTSTLPSTQPTESTTLSSKSTEPTSTTETTSTEKSTTSSTTILEETVTSTSEEIKTKPPLTSELTSSTLPATEKLTTINATSTSTYSATSTPAAATTISTESSDEILQMTGISESSTKSNNETEDILEQKLEELEKEVSEREEEVSQLEQLLENQEKEFEEKTQELENLIKASTESENKYTLSDVDYPDDFSTSTEFSGPDIEEETETTQMGSPLEASPDSSEVQNSVNRFIYDPDEEVWHEKPDIVDPAYNQTLMEYEDCTSTTLDSNVYDSTESPVVTRVKRELAVTSPSFTEDVSERSDVEDEPIKLTAPSFVLKENEWVDQDNAQFEVVSPLDFRGYTRVYQRWHKVPLKMLTPRDHVTQQEYQQMNETISDLEHPTTDKLETGSTERTVDDETVTDPSPSSPRRKRNDDYYGDCDDDDDDCDNDDEDDNQSEEMISERTKKSRDHDSNIRLKKAEIAMLENENEELIKKENMLKQIQEALQISKHELRRVKSSILHNKLLKRSKRDLDLNETSNPSTTSGTPRTCTCGASGTPTPVPLSTGTDKTTPCSNGTDKNYVTRKSSYTVHVIDLEYDDELEGHRIKLVTPSKEDWVVDEGLEDETTTPSTTESTTETTEESTVTTTACPPCGQTGSVPWPTEASDNYHIGGTQSWRKEVADPCNADVPVKKVIKPKFQHRNDRFADDFQSSLEHQLVQSIPLGKRSWSFDFDSNGSKNRDLIKKTIKELNIPLLTTDAPSIDANLASESRVSINDDLKKCLEASKSYHSSGKLDYESNANDTLFIWKLRNPKIKQSQELISPAEFYCIYKYGLSQNGIDNSVPRRHLLAVKNHGQRKVKAPRSPVHHPSSNKTSKSQVSKRGDKHALEESVGKVKKGSHLKSNKRSIFENIKQVFNHILGNDPTTQAPVRVVKKSFRTKEYKIPYKTYDRKHKSKHLKNKLLFRKSASKKHRGQKKKKIGVKHRKYWMPIDKKRGVKTRGIRQSNLHDLAHKLKDVKKVHASVPSGKDSGKLGVTEKIVIYVTRIKNTHNDSHLSPNSKRSRKSTFDDLNFEDLYRDKNLNRLISYFADKVVKSVEGSSRSLSELDPRLRVKVVRGVPVSKDGSFGSSSDSNSEFTIDLSDMNADFDAEKYLKRSNKNSLTSRLIGKSERKMNLGNHFAKKRKNWINQIKRDDIVQRLRKKLLKELENRMESDKGEKEGKKDDEFNGVNSDGSVERIDKLGEKIKIMYAMHHKNNQHMKPYRRKRDSADSLLEGVNFNNEYDKKLMKALVDQIFDVQRGVNTTLQIIRRRLASSSSEPLNHSQNTVNTQSLRDRRLAKKEDRNVTKIVKKKTSKPKKKVSKKSSGSNKKLKPRYDDGHIDELGNDIKLILKQEDSGKRKKRNLEVGFKKRKILSVESYDYEEKIYPGSTEGVEGDAEVEMKFEKNKPEVEKKQSKRSNIFRRKFKGKKKKFRSVKRKVKEMRKCKNCICDIEKVIQDLKNMAIDRHNLLDRVASYECKKFVNVGKEIVLTPSRVLEEIYPARSDLAQAKGLKYIQLRDLENVLQAGEVVGRDHEILSFPGMDLVIPCNREGAEYNWMISISRPNYTWTRQDDTPVSGTIHKNGNLELSSLSIQDAGNYSCTLTFIDPDNEEVVKHVYKHGIQVVTLPRYSLRGGNRYRVENCEDEALDTLTTYLPQKLNTILCPHKLCDTFIFAPHCYDHEISIKVLLTLSSLTKAISVDSKCGLRCHKAIQDKIILLLSKNLGAILTKNIVFRLSHGRRQTLVPDSNPRFQRKKDYVSDDKNNEIFERSTGVGLLVGCPAGYGLNTIHCVPCLPGFHSKDLSPQCKRCPVGSYQPNLGSRVCRLCTNPFIDGCYEMLWTSPITLGSFSLIIIILSIGLILCITISCVRKERDRNKCVIINAKNESRRPLINSRGNSIDEDRVWKRKKSENYKTHEKKERPLVYGVDVIPGRKNNKIDGIEKNKTPVSCTDSCHSNSADCPECKKLNMQNHCFKKVPRPPVPYPDFDR